MVDIPVVRGSLGAFRAEWLRSTAWVFHLWGARWTTHGFPDLVWGSRFRGIWAANALDSFFFWGGGRGRCSNSPRKSCWLLREGP